MANDFSAKDKDATPGSDSSHGTAPFSPQDKLTENPAARSQSAMLASRTGVAPPPLIKLEGDAHQRGQRYGELARDRIAHSIETYRQMFAGCNIKWHEAAARALPCLECVANTHPALLDELQGIASGSGMDYASLAALNCRTEILPPDYLARISGISAAQLPDNGHIAECTSLAFSRPDSDPWLAQNWDWIGCQRQALVILESRPQQGPAHIVISEAGMTAKIGFNSYGLGITLNILRSKHDGQAPGWPVHLFLRALLDCENVEQACELATSLPFAGSSNIMIADPSGAICSIEISPKGARLVKPQPGPHPELQPESQAGLPQSLQLCHTNHFLHSELSGDDAGLTGNISTQARLLTAESQIDSIADFSGIRKLLADTSDGLQSVCRFPDLELPELGQVETVVAVAMNLRSRQLWVTGAQPSVNEFRAYTLH